MLDFRTSNLERESLKWWIWKRPTIFGRVREDAVRQQRLRAELEAGHLTRAEITLEVDAAG